MFHERLKQHMQKDGVTSAMLSRSTGIAPSNICHLLSGTRPPKLKTIVKILNALPLVDARWLITGGTKNETDANA